MLVGRTARNFSARSAPALRSRSLSLLASIDQGTSSSRVILYDAESLAQTSLAAVQSAAHTALNVVSLGPKAVAKSSAVAAAKSGAATAAERDNHGTQHAPASQG